MNTDRQVLYSLSMAIRGDKIKDGFQVSSTIPHKIAKLHNIEPGDTLDVEVIRHHKPKESDQE